MSLGPPHPHQRPAVSPGLSGPMGTMNLGPPTPSSNGLPNGLHPPTAGTAQSGEVGASFQTLPGGKGPSLTPRQSFPPSTPNYGTPMPFSNVGASPRQPPPVSSPFPYSFPSPMGPPSMASGKAFGPPPVGPIPKTQMTSNQMQPQGIVGGSSTPGIPTPGGIPSSKNVGPPSISNHGPSPVSTPKQSGTLLLSENEEKSQPPGDTALDANPSSTSSGGPISNSSVSGIPSQSPIGGMSPMPRPAGPSPISSGGAPPMHPMQSGPPPMSSSSGSTPGGQPPIPSSSGLPPMSAPSGPPHMLSSTGMSPISAPGGPPRMISSSGMPPLSSPSGPPAMSSNRMPGMPPPMSSSGGMPPMSSSSGMPGMPPPMSSSGGMPPISSSGGMPPMSSSGGMPPMSSSGGMPPMSSSGGMHLLSSPSGPPQMPSSDGMSFSSSLNGPPSLSSGGMPSSMSELGEKTQMSKTSELLSAPGISGPGESALGMPSKPVSGDQLLISTPTNQSSMGISPMSAQGGSSSMRMPANSPLAGPSPIGLRPATTPGNFPPMPTPGAPSMGMPPMSSPGGLPPMSTPGGFPMGMPPMSTPGGPSMMPPMSTPGGPSMMPPMSTPGGPSMMPPMSTPGGPSMGMPPMYTPGGFPPASTPSRPPMGVSQMPNSGGASMGMQPIPSPGGFPSISTPGGPPMGMPPTSAPGAPHPMSTPGGFPPRSGTLPPPPGPGMSNSHGGLRPGGYPNINQPVSNAGGMPPPMMSTQPGYPSQSQFGGTPSSGKRALDPDNMPSPIAVMEDDSKNNSGFFDTREKGLVPPLVTTKFVVRDCGNASPRYVRSTMYHIPATPDLMKQCGVPFGLVITPLAIINEGESEPAVTDFGPGGPVRCVRCKAYMCPFMQFVDGGRRFQCIFCKATSDVPQEYFQHLDHNGMRLDHYQRPELCMGTYEVLATKEYCRESVEPLTPGIIFAIDVSYPMIKEGIVNLVCQNMKELLKTLPTDIHCDKAKMKVGFMAYDNKINFYNIKGVLTQPQQMTVSDVNDMFVPLVDGLMVDINEADSVINSLMEQIPVLFGETRETETILGPVIQAGKEAFKAAKCSGKLVVFHHNLPICDAPGKLKNRDDRKLLNTEKEKTVLSPQSRFYNELGQECVSVGCSVDLFLFNNAYIDVATLSQVCRLTGGQLYKYTYFQSGLDGERFLSDLRHNIKRPVVFDAIMRVRTSTGVRPVDFFGSFFMANSTDTELASINSDMSVACEIKHDDKLTDEDGVYIQIALLFTSCSGQRRLRIINLSLNTGTNLTDMYRSCDLDTIINFTAKQSISRLMESNPKTVKEFLINNCAQILACYRKNCASASSVGQLILPECMKLLPLYTNCLIKSDALVGGQDVGCDERAFLMSIVSSMDVKSSVSFFYPSLIPIHDVDPSESHIPKIIRCSYEKIREDGVYLLENGLHIFMYIGLGTDSSWVKDIFGVESASQIDVEKVRFDQVRDNSLYKRVSGIIRDLRTRRSRYMRLFFVRPKDKLDILFKHFLCEDRTGHDGNFSYVDFLCFMHKEIRALLG